MREAGSYGCCQFLKVEMSALYTTVYFVHSSRIMLISYELGLRAKLQADVVLCDRKPSIRGVIGWDVGSRVDGPRWT